MLQQLSTAVGTKSKFFSIIYKAWHAPAPSMSLPSYHAILCLIYYALSTPVFSQNLLPLQKVLTLVLCFITLQVLT